MSRDDFRRELTSAFDDISGSPSPVLSDRVRSALAEAPERKGPYWMAGLAAAVIAVILVGVLVVANPLNRPRSAGPHVIPTPTSSPSGSPAPSPSGSPTPSPSAAASPTPGSLPPFVCAASAPMTAQPAPAVAFIDALRTGSHTGYDRLTVEFNNSQPSSIELKTQAGTVFTMSPSGQHVTLMGQNGILVTIDGADAHTAYTGPVDIKTGDPGLVEVRVVQDFEGVVQLGLGTSGPACYRAFVLTNPTRLVIDVQVGA